MKIIRVVLPAILLVSLQSTMYSAQHQHPSLEQGWENVPGFDPLDRSCMEDSTERFLLVERSMIGEINTSTFDTLPEASEEKTSDTVPAAPTLARKPSFNPHRDTLMWSLSASDEYLLTNYGKDHKHRGEDRTVGIGSDNDNDKAIKRFAAVGRRITTLERAKQFIEIVNSVQLQLPADALQASQELINKDNKTQAALSLTTALCEQLARREADSFAQQMQDIEEQLQAMTQATLDQGLTMKGLNIANKEGLQHIQTWADIQNARRIEDLALTTKRSQEDQHFATLIQTAATTALAHKAKLDQKFPNHITTENPKNPFLTQNATNRISPQYLPKLAAELARKKTSKNHTAESKEA